MNDIKKNTSIHSVEGRKGSYDIDVVSNEVIHRPAYDDCITYRYTISFNCNDEDSSDYKEMMERIAVRSGAVTAMQLYNDITACMKEAKLFKSLIIEVVLHYEIAKTRNRSFVSYEDDKLKAIEYTNGFIGPKDDFGSWSMKRDGSWKFSKIDWSVVYNDHRISYSFNSALDRIKYPVSAIYGNVDGCVKEAVNIYKKYFT